MIVDEDGNELQEQFELINHTANIYNSLNLQLAIEHDGYAIVYLANESMMDVFFDELNLKHERLVWQENSYYPFGMAIKPLDKEGEPNHGFTYNGKELEEMTGLLEFEARMHDPQTGRFHGIDPKAEEYNFQSSYVYAANDPIKFIEVKGESPGDYFDTKGNQIGSDGENNNDKYVVTDKKEVSSIKKASKKGRTTQQSSLASSVALPSDATLTEAINVLDRTIENGGKREESSLVMNGGRVVRGEQGEEVRYGQDTHASAELPDIPEGSTTRDVEATIHSHPTKGEIVNGRVYGGNALARSRADQRAFVPYRTNIIVGRLGPTTAIEVTDNAGNKSIKMNQPSNGIVIYRGTRAQPSLVLTKKTVEKILNP